MAVSFRLGKYFDKMLRLLCGILSTETALFMDRSLHFIPLSMERWLLMDRSVNQLCLLRCCECGV